MIGTKPAKVDFCECLIHPFQNDPGISQRQRVMEELLSGQAKIDPRKMADLLDYFYQLSRQINYYDNTLGVSDWQPFFEKSIPFVGGGQQGPVQGEWGVEWELPRKSPDPPGRSAGQGSDGLDPGSRAPRPAPAFSIRT